MIVRHVSMFMFHVFILCRTMTRNIELKGKSGKSVSAMSETESLFKIQQFSGMIQTTCVINTRFTLGTGMRNLANALHTVCILNACLWMKPLSLTVVHQEKTIIPPLGV